MTNLIATSGLVLCLSVISCYAFLNEDDLAGPGLDGNGCHNYDAPTNGVKGRLNAGSFSKTKQFNSDYQLKWKYNSTHIMFQAHVKTKGYVGLGISKEGRMNDADMFVGWIDDKGVAHFSDRNSKQYGLPDVDEHQDWHLVSAEQSDDYITVTSIRPLDPCDKDDLPVKKGNNFVLYAYGLTEVTDSDIDYHSHRRGSVTIDLFAN